MVDQLKRMLRVMAYIALPFVVGLIAGFRIQEEAYRLFVFVVGGLISFAVATWIGICRSDEDSADI